MSRFPKQIRFSPDALNKIVEGVNIVADAVSTTLGPKGANVAINQGHGAPIVMHDGVTVAQHIDLPDVFQDMGAQLIKEAAQKTVDRVGDGTTLTTVLAREIITEGHKLTLAGKNPQTLKAELEKELTSVKKELSKLSLSVQSQEQIQQVATISSASPNIGEMIAQAHEKVGKEGYITSEIGKGFETTIEYKQGMEIDRGYLSSGFITNQATVEAEIENPYILVTDKKFGFANELIPFLENFMKWETENKNLVIIAGEVVEESLAMLVINHLDARSPFHCVAIQAPAFGGRRTDELEDIATLTGGNVILEESGRKIESVILEELGRADKIVSDRDHTVIYGGRGTKETITARIGDIRAQITVANTDFDRKIKEQRLAKIAGGVAIINVGASTEPEVRELQERVIDAIAATKAAVEEGVVAGGEITLFEIAKKIKHPVIKAALQAPFKKLMENADIEYADAVKKLTGRKYPWGIDVMDGHRKDMLKAGIIDPTKVLRLALEHAVSVAATTLTTKVSISEVPDEK